MAWEVGCRSIHGRLLSYEQGILTVGSSPCFISGLQSYPRALMLWRHRHGGRCHLVGWRRETGRLIDMPAVDRCDVGQRRRDASLSIQEWEAEAKAAPPAPGFVRARGLARAISQWAAGPGFVRARSKSFVRIQPRHRVGSFCMRNGARRLGSLVPLRLRGRSGSILHRSQRVGPGLNVPLRSSFVKSAGPGCSGSGVVKSWSTGTGVSPALRGAGRRRAF